MKLSEAERIAYNRYSDDLHYQASMVESSYGLGKLDGREEGREATKITAAFPSFCASRQAKSQNP